MNAGRLAPNAIQTGDILLNGERKTTLSYGIAVRSYQTHSYLSRTSAHLLRHQDWKLIINKCRKSSVILESVLISHMVRRGRINNKVSWILYMTGICYSRRCTYRHADRSREHHVLGRLKVAREDDESGEEEGCRQHNHGDGVVWMRKLVCWKLFCAWIKRGWETSAEHCVANFNSTSFALLRWTDQWSWQVSTYYPRTFQTIVDSGEIVGGLFWCWYDLIQEFFF